MAKPPRRNNSPPEDRIPKKIRSYQLRDIFDRRNTIAGAWIHLLTSNIDKAEPITPRQFESMLQHALDVLPGGIVLQALEDSLSSLAGDIPTREKLRTAAWRIVGNTRLLQAGKHIPLWAVQKYIEWVPFQIMSARPSRNVRGDIGTMYGCRALAGSIVTLTAWQWWSIRQCRYFSRAFGFSRIYGVNSAKVSRYPYRSFAQLVTMRFYGLVSPESCGAEPGFSIVECPTSCQNWNRLQLKRRYRIDDGYDCPDGHPNTFMCHHCPAGYDRCPAGTHRYDWVKAFCTSCKQNSYFDEELSDEWCVRCYNAKISKTHE